MFSRAFPPDVIVFDTDALLHARFGGSKRGAQLLALKKYSLPTGTFGRKGITPELEKSESLTEVVRRIRSEAGRLDRVSVLLPDSWFRINILSLAQLPERRTEAEEMVRWTLRRSLPVNPEELRLSYEKISRNGSPPRVLAVAALEKTLRSIEAAFSAAGISIVLIEPVGINLWNAISIQEKPSNHDRLLFYVRRNEFTIALFHGDGPVFIRSRSMSGERTLLQEIRLSASYLKGTVQLDVVDRCYAAGSELTQPVIDVISDEFGTTVETISLGEFVTCNPALDTARVEAEIAACTGVFIS